MSIRPVSFNADGSMEVVFDETGHTGTIAAADIKHSLNPDGTENHDFIVLNCPDGCGASSTHPVGGGAAPPMVQEMFVRHASANGCPCADEMPPDLPTELIGGHIKEHCEAMDGEGRWQVQPAA